MSYIKCGTAEESIECMPFFDILFTEFMVFDIGEPNWRYRDRLFIDSIDSFHLLQDKFRLFRKNSLEESSSMPFDSLGEHVCYGVEHMLSPKGQAQTFAVGAAIAAKALYARTDNISFLKEKIYTYINIDSVSTDVSQGAGRVAGHLGLNNLIVFYSNVTGDTSVELSENIAMKYSAWGWNIIEIDGENRSEIRRALSNAIQEKSKPTLIIGNINRKRTSIIQASVRQEEIIEKNEYRKTKLADIVTQRRTEEAIWLSTHPQKAKDLDDWFSGELPPICWDELQQEDDVSTRNASGKCLELLSKSVKNMIVSSADLCNSDKTDGFLKHSHPISSSDFSGGFFHAGVSELTMACVCIGMALHGGLIVSMGTFLVFSDYIKPAMRMAALMELPVKFIFTHDSFRVGEDGATHEPVEQEAQLRLMECLKNFHGEDSVRVLRPCDAHATTQCWKIAMENHSTPTTLVLSRQNIKRQPEGTNYNLVGKGAYPIIDAKNPDIILLASGSEVSTLVEVSYKLNQAGIISRVVSCPSEGLFRRQTKAYQETILPYGAKIFALTAGLAAVFEKMVGANGRVYGLNHFGHSAPADILEEKFGFTSNNIYKEVLRYLNEQDFEV